MIFEDRLKYFDQCICVSDKEHFNMLFSKNIFNTFDKGFDIYKDYINHKQEITSVSCDVIPGELILHLVSEKDIGDIISNNIPKRGITSHKTDEGVDLHIKLMDCVL